MTDAYPGAVPNASAFQDDSDQSTKQVITEQVSAIKDEVVDDSSRVLDAAKDNAADVIAEARSQGADLLHQTQDEIREQAAVQQQRVAAGLQSVSDELNEMARNSSGGVAADLVARAAVRAGSAASWLDARDPGALLTELKTYAALRPGTFIASAVVVGAVAGRLTRSLASGAPDEASAPRGSTSKVPLEQTPVRPPELREPGIQNASYPAPATQPDPATPLYSALLTDRVDDSVEPGVD